jgi:hypothetical protein
MQTFFYFIKIIEEFGVIRLIFALCWYFYALRRMIAAYTAISVTAPPATTEITQPAIAPHR